MGRTFAGPAAYARRPWPIATGAAPTSLRPTGPSSTRICARPMGCSSARCGRLERSVESGRPRLSARAFHETPMTHEGPPAAVTSGTPMNAEALPAREVMEFDVAIVGAGPAGLAAAIRLKQLAPDS